MAIWDRDYMRDRPAERSASKRAARAPSRGSGGVWLFILAMVATGVALNWEQVRNAAQRVAAGSSLLPGRSETAEPASNWININRASAKELRTLPGISPELAAAIVAGRPYQSVDDLRRVKGINAARLEIIRALITVDSEH